jgi:hypothetical protein
MHNPSAKGIDAPQNMQIGFKPETPCPKTAA